MVEYSGWEWVELLSTWEQQWAWEKLCPGHAPPLPVLVRFGKQYFLLSHFPSLKDQMIYQQNTIAYFGLK